MSKRRTIRPCRPRRRVAAPLLALLAASVVACRAGEPPSSATAPATAPTSPSASQQPSETGWIDLFDGVRTAGLRGYGQATFPADRWVIEAGRLMTVPGPGTDLVTEDTYGDFELEFTWAVEQGGNSGVMYGVAEGDQPAWTTGPEYQLLDDMGHPDGSNPATSAASLYALIAPAPTRTLHPYGELNEGLIVVRDGHVEHWLNGDLAVAYDWGSDDIRARIEASKFRDLPGFMATPTGRIVVQHHGEGAWFERIRVRPLT
jgi:hypothetical protein